MGYLMNKEISNWTLCVWNAYLEQIAKKAEEGEGLDNDGKLLKLKEIHKLAKRYAEEIINYR